MLSSLSLKSLVCPLELGKRREAKKVLKLLPRANKSDSGDYSDEKKTGTKNVSSSLGFSKALVARAAVGIFALGFVDAGYSGDWSRIGFISKEIEELLKLAAFVIVPFCIFIIFSISDETETSN
ncbi:hypothetical protein LUZ60_005655 [Juncus effusus]|nr:hypothetical protein LUZ60_005655 [Juncus effusus]